MKPYLMAIILILSLTFIPAAGASEIELVQTDSVENTFVIDECTTIVESGKYTIGSNLTAVDRDFCIIIEETQGVALNAQNHTIVGDLRAAVYVDNSRNVTVQNLLYNGSERFGILVIGGEGIVLENNTIQQNQDEESTLASRAMFVRHSEDILLRNNTVQGIGLRKESGLDSGLSFRHSRGITVLQNQIYGTSSAVSFVNSSNIWVKRNSLERNVYGIQMRRFSHDITVQANDIRNHGLCAMDVKNSSDILIDNNFMDRHAGLGLEINATNVTIVNNVLNDSTSFGIVVATNSSRVRIENNTVTNSSSYAGVGIFGRVTDVGIERNTIENNAPHGIVLEQSAVRIRIRNNSISHNTHYGIAIRPSVRDIKISGNRIAGNGDRAIANEVPGGVKIEDNSGTTDTRKPGAITREDESSDSNSLTTTDSPGQSGFSILIALIAILAVAWLAAIGRSNRG